ncbi:MAG: hypothetical protein M3525_07125 [Acidobacteriota bacterium]|nr:hypothetical protein [Acidobacteriota bacterium]
MKHNDLDLNKLEVVRHRSRFAIIGQPEHSSIYTFWKSHKQSGFYGCSS